VENTRESMSFPHFAALHKMLNKARSGRWIKLYILKGWPGIGWKIERRRMWDSSGHGWQW